MQRTPKNEEDAKELFFSNAQGTLRREIPYVHNVRRDGEPKEDFPPTDKIKLPDGERFLRQLYEIQLSNTAVRDKTEEDFKRDLEDVLRDKYRSFGGTNIVRVNRYSPESEIAEVFLFWSSEMFNEFLDT